MDSCAADTGGMMDVFGNCLLDVDLLALPADDVADHEIHCQQPSTGLPFLHSL